ncbi:MAG: single-stranded DNA-binding protein [Candidatus Hermodarchaeota archaeon]
MSESQEKEDIELKEVKISELSPFDRRLQVTFVVIEKGESRTITSKKTNEEHTLADIKVGDDTGTIILTLWDATIDQISEGSTYVVKNGYINVFQQHMRLALGKWGTLEESEKTIELDKVNMDNDRSEEIHEDRRRRGRRRPRRSQGYSSYDRDQSNSGSRY